MGTNLDRARRMSATCAGAQRRVRQSTAHAPTPDPSATNVQAASLTSTRCLASRESSSGPGSWLSARQTRAGHHVMKGRPRPTSTCSGAPRHTVVNAPARDRSHSSASACTQDARPCSSAPTTQGLWAAPPIVHRQPNCSHQLHGVRPHVRVHEEPQRALLVAQAALGLQLRQRRRRPSPPRRRTALFARQPDGEAAALGAGRCAAGQHPVQHARAAEEHQPVVQRRHVHGGQRPRDQPEVPAVRGLPPAAHTRHVKKKMWRRESAPHTTSARCASRTSGSSRRCW